MLYQRSRLRQVSGQVESSCSKHRAVPAWNGRSRLPSATEAADGFRSRLQRPPGPRPPQGAAQLRPSKGVVEFEDDLCPPS